MGLPSRCTVVLDSWECPNPVRYKTKGLCSTHHGQLYRGTREFTRIRPRKSNGACQVRDELDRKHCNRCDAWKPPHMFSDNPKTSDGLNVTCRRCVRVRRIEKKFNLSEMEYRGLLEAQSGVCAGCGTRPEGSDLSFRIDHDHSCCPEPGRSCGKCVRGLLCLNCNYALGVLQDDPTRLRRLANYLEEN